MGRVETNVPHLKINLGVWRKLYALTGGYVDNIEDVSRGHLWSVGLSPDFWVVIDAMKSWKVPFHVVMILWALRERQLDNGGFLRLGELSRYVETGSVYRYVEIAALAGETLKDDTHMRKALDWLLEHQLEDGSFPTHEMSSIGEVGTTGRTVRILAMAIENEAGQSTEKILKAIERALAYLKERHHRSVDLGWWSRTERDNGRSIVGASSLAVLAILKVRELSRRFPLEVPLETVEPTLRWLLREFEETTGWPESAGEVSKIDTTFYASWALLWAWESGLPVEKGKVRSKILDAFERLHYLTRDTLYDTSFVLRFLALLVRYRRLLGIKEERLRALIRKYLRRLMGEIGRVFKSDSDTYLMELVGITLLEASKAMKELGMNDEVRELRRFPGMPPSFILKEILEKSSNASDVLYLLIGPKTKWKPFVSLIDTLVKMDILTTLIGVTLGLLVIINDFSDAFFRVMLSPHPSSAGLLSFLMALMLTLVWIGIKVVPEKSRLEAVMSYTLAMLAAYLYLKTFLKASGIEASPDAFAFLKVLLLLAIVIDVTVKLLDTAVFSKILGG
ncbi:terpene cyclase/mutase family protein [Thermococcus indicus]|uniref:Terpene cyclase/mutase family protein n=1 Tax=Thermococcus indicus TaxID=2586643 RepID=A0A4Y5SLY5_9EURY|nr:prenyltransferase/squalene oxidase repeat-containing protein [Thermococcus indicus]QDA31927.1 terpene cyclase/mutase family protein [Thermococcus indicus]